MMTMFFAQRVIWGETAFATVLGALKQGGVESLIDSGLLELAPMEFGGTAQA